MGITITSYEYVKTAIETREYIQSEHIIIGLDELNNMVNHCIALEKNLAIMV